MTEQHLAWLAYGAALVGFLVTQRMLAMYRRND